MKEKANPFHNKFEWKSFQLTVKKVYTDSLDEEARSEFSCFQVTQIAGKDITKLKFKGEISTEWTNRNHWKIDVITISQNPDFKKLVKRYKITTYQ